jgi:hypothetical protein
MAKKTNIIDEKLSAVIDILIRSQAHFNYCKYLNTREDFYEYQIIRKYSILDFAKVSFLIVLILDLCKLYNYDKDEKYNLQKILDILINNYSKIHFANPITKVELLSLREELNSREIISIASKLKTLRNKHYAHLDPNRPEIMEIMPTFDEFEFLWEKAFNIHAKINFHLYDSSTCINQGTSDIGDGILTQLIKLENLN